MRLRFLLFLLALALAPAVTGHTAPPDASQYYVFVDALEPIGLTSLPGRIAPWPAEEKLRVGEALRNIHARAPNLLPNAALRAPLKLVIDTRPADDNQCHAMYLENAIACGPQLLKRPSLPHAIAHELVHFVDQRWRPTEASRSREWRAIVEPRIASLTVKLRAAGHASVDAAIHAPDPGKLPLAHGEGLPSVYAAKNLAEALAEYASFMVLPSTIGPQRLRPPIPPDAAAFVNARILAPLPAADAVSRFYDEALGHLERGDYERGVAALDKAIAAAPAYDVALGTRGQALMRLRRFDAAVRDFTAAIDIAGPDEWRARNARQGRGRAWSELQQWDRAIVDYTWCIAVDPRVGSNFAARGRARLQLRDPAGALADFDRAIAIDPTAAASYSYRGRARWALRDYAGARADFEELVRLAPQRRPEVEAMIRSIEQERARSGR